MSTPRGLGEMKGLADLEAAQRELEVLMGGLTETAMRWLGAIAVEQALGRSVLVTIGVEENARIGADRDKALRAFLEASVASGLLIDKGTPSLFRVTSSSVREPLYAIHDRYAELLLRHLHSDGDLEDIVIETGRAHGARSVGDIVLALQRGDLQGVERSLLIRRAPRDPELLSGAEWLRHSICEPFDGAWLEKTWGRQALTIAERVLRESHDHFSMTGDLYAWAGPRALLLPAGKERLALEKALIEHAVFANDTAAIAEWSTDIPPATLLGYQCAARFADGDLLGARQCLEAAIGEPPIKKKGALRSSLHHAALPRCGALTPILALLWIARDQADARTLAKRLIQSGDSDSERGTAKAFRTLLRYLEEAEAHHRRIDVHQMDAGAGAWEILLSALTVHLHFDRESSRASWAARVAREALKWKEAGAELIARQGLLLAIDLHPEYACAEMDRQGLSHFDLPSVSLWELVAKKPEWKKTLEALASVSEDVSDHAEVRYRAAFYIDMSDGSIARPALQEYRSRGGWSAGRRLSLSEIFEQKDALPPDDLRVLECSRESSNGKREWLPEAHEMLIGHPRVFNGARGQSEVEVVRGSCRIETEEEGGYIRVVVEPAGARLGINVVPESESRLVVYRVTKAMQKVIDVLPEGVRIPREHEREIVAVLSKLSESVDVKSRQLGAEVDIEPDATPCVRFAPRSGAWLVEFGVRPFGEEGRFFTAGHGRTSITLQSAGRRLSAKRDLEQERARVDALVSACPTLIRDPDEREEAENNDQADQWIFGEESVLALLSELRDSALPCELEWPESNALRLRGNVNARSLHGSLRTLKGWYLATGGVRVDDVTEVLLGDLVRAPSIAGGRFIRLQNGDYLEVEKRVRHVVAALASISAGKPHRSEVRIHPGAISTLRALTGPDSGFDVDPESLEWLSRVERFSRQSYDLPRTLQADLRPYQLEGFRWLSRLTELGLGACLADDMGLGKTLQILALLLTRTADGPALVIAPTSVCSNWVREMKRFAPSLVPIEYVGPQRASLLTDLATQGAGKVVICSYALLQEDQERLTNVEWGVAVLDEAQFIKNAESQRARAAFRLSAKQRIAATGTPVENHFGDLWSIFHFLNPGLLGDWPSYNRRFVRPIERDGDTAPQGILRQLIQPYLLRRTKREVLPDLPPVTELTHEVELSHDHAVRYAYLRKQIHDKLFTPSGRRNNKIEILSEITRLRRFCCHPKLVFPDADNESAKIETFIDLVSELRENGHRALVFSQYVDFLRFVREALDELSISYEYLDGSTPQRDRQKRVDAFQNGDATLFLISLKAGGFGLNLTAADYVIHLDPWWNPAVEAQATDRAHRIGQQNRVTVYRLVTKNTIEEKIVALHRKKQKLALALLEGTDEAAKLSDDELLQLIENDPASP